MRFKRPPDRILGTKKNPYMLRWYIIPRNRFFNIYLHKFLRSDDDRALHDHPWWSVGMILKCMYMEEMPMYPEEYRAGKSRSTYMVTRFPWRPVFRRANAIHRIELLRSYHFGPVKKSHIFPQLPIHVAGYEPVWTIFITGPIIREWGFWCPFGFRSHKEFLAGESQDRKNNKYSTVGRGCE